MKNNGEVEVAEQQKRATIERRALAMIKKRRLETGRMTEFTMNV